MAKIHLPSAFWQIWGINVSGTREHRRYPSKEKKRGREIIADVPRKGRENKGICDGALYGTITTAHWRRKEEGMVLFMSFVPSSMI